ncbi:bifunctional prephenate dehydrogenase/3-phosphoshikimate 1-carboxyvinyltransferase [Gilvimarinus sp. F26214L]|uniref:bifunctional prephenate dehydrogenase/3-phosphoshikimate 1-carboxyvinyltransferase n=1 Tax=Gilvimarinus sp. DZF01 TaxID=3461371 RepID=UPI004045276B
MKIKTLVVIGFGLIGASVAAGLKSARACQRVVAIAPSQHTRDTALQQGLADAAFDSLAAVADQLGKGDLICIAVPTLSVTSVLQQIADTVSCDVTITDCASVKGHVEKAAQQVFGQVPSQLILGHPIAGSEKSGVGAADSRLFVRHRVILTPSGDADEHHLQRVIRMWRALGAEVVGMPVKEHDDVLAATSHLPHLIAYSLVDTLAHDTENENIFRYAAGGFRDFTRIASSDPTMWHDIVLANRDSVLRALDLFGNNLAQLRDAIDRDDGDYLMGVFTRAKAARDHFSSRVARKSYTESSNHMARESLQYRVQPGGTITGSLRVPGDKSISHRSIMLGSIAEGITHIEGFLEGEDALATLQAFRDMGVVIEGPNQGSVVVHGVGMHGLQAPPGPLYLGNSGTSMRLLAGLLAGQVFDTEMSGDGSLSKRPMNRVADPLRTMGAKIDTEARGLPPLRISGGQNLHGIHYDMPMASAQVKSCLLLAGLYAEGETTVVEPGVTRDHTERMLKGFGYPVNCDGARVSLEGGGTLKACDIEVPGDISSAAFFMVAAAIAPGSDLTLTHVGINPTRTGILNILRLMGADIGFANKREVGGEPVADIRIRYAPLHGIDIPPELVPLAIDEFPALFVAAACAEGTTRLTGAEELRVKESDRIQVMAEGLQTLGVDAEPTPDGMIIKGGPMGGGIVESHDDHRIAMSFVVAGLRASQPIHIRNCANVATSFPGFVELAKAAGISIETNAT